MWHRPPLIGKGLRDLYASPCLFYIMFFNPISNFYNKNNLVMWAPSLFLTCKTEVKTKTTV
jgi:hypothetical protein